MHSPADPNDVVAYVEANPVRSSFKRTLEAGIEFDGDLIDIPDSDFYGYAYVDGRPVLVEEAAVA